MSIVKKIGLVPTGENDKPKQEIKILSTEVEK